MLSATSMHLLETLMRLSLSEIKHHMCQIYSVRVPSKGNGHGLIEFPCHFDSIQVQNTDDYIFYKDGTNLH